MMRCSKAVPRRGHSAFLVSALVLSSPTVPLSIISLPLCSRGWAFFAVKHSLNAELFRLGLTILGMVTRDSGSCATFLPTPQGWELALSDCTCLLTTLVRSITFIFFPNETELRKPPNCFYKQAAMAYYLFSVAWSGLVRAACRNKNSTVFHGWDSKAKI